MKTKKILSIFLVVSLLFTIATINVSAAEGKTYTTSVSKAITSKFGFNPDNFDLHVSMNDDTIYSLDGNSLDYSSEILAFTATYVDFEGKIYTGDYTVSPEEFFAVIAKRDADIEYAEEYNKDKEIQFHLKVKDITLSGEFNTTFADDSVFGSLEYTFTVKGFTAPAIDAGGLGLDLGGATDAVKLPTDITMTGTVAEFPTIKEVTVLSKPEKTAYTDADKFDATGLQLAITTTDDASGTFTYNETNAYAFKFNPSNKEKLSTYDSEVISYLNGVEVLKIPITVNHRWSDGPVNITTDKYSENKPGYHAIVCEGCGETHNAQPHKPTLMLDENGNPMLDDEGNEIYCWTPNNDQTFVQNGTESSICTDCGTILIRDAFGTADFNTVFADMHFLKVLFEYINILLRFIGAATY